MPEVLKKEIEARLPAEEPFAVFDFDNTCIAGDIGEATWKHLIKTGRLDGSLNERYDALIADGKAKEAYLLYSTILNGFTEVEAAQAAREAIARERGLAVRPQVMELMQFLKDKGVECWIISASHEVMVRVAMEYLSIEARLIGVKNKIVNGRYTAQLEEPAPMFEGKVACMRAYIHPAQSPLLVIDDNPSGISLLKTAQIPVVVDHGQALAREAGERGWFIL